MRTSNFNDSLVVEWYGDDGQHVRLFPFEGSIGPNGLPVFAVEFPPSRDRTLEQESVIFGEVSYTHERAVVGN